MVSRGTGGPGVPTAYQNSDSDSSTTKSAVEKGELIIRNKEQQKQDISELSRDTESANNPLKQIFDKQKELDKIETVELIKDIAQQAKSVMNKYDRIQAQNDVDKNKDALSKLEAEKAYNKLSDAEKAKYKTVEDYYNQNKDYFYYVAVDEQLKTNRENNKNLGGMGSDVSKGIDSAISIVTGIITGNITGGLAADIIRKQLYDKEVKDLTEAEKQNISALAQLATGLAVASVGGDVGDVSTGIAAGKNEAENNFLVVLRVGWQILKPSKLGDGMRPITLTPELMAAAILAENKNIPYEEAEKFINGLTKEQIAELNKQGIAVSDSSYSPEYKDALIDLYDQTQNVILSNETSNDNKDKSQASASTQTSSGSVTGGPSLPPDDDKDKNKVRDKIQEEKLNDLPDNVQDTFSKYEKNGWNGNFNGQTPGTNAGRTFKNSDNKLPSVDSKGNPITYREFDVNNKIAGQARDLNVLLEEIMVRFIIQTIIIKHL